MNKNEVHLGGCFPEASDVLPSIPYAVLRSRPRVFITTWLLNCMLRIISEAEKAPEIDTHLL